MRRSKIKNIKTERELRLFLFDLEKRWKKAFDLKDPRKKLQEVIAIRNEAKQLLLIFKKLKEESEDNGGFFSKCYRLISRWLSASEKRWA